MNITEILAVVAPIIANTIMSVVIPNAVKKFSMTKLQAKLEEVNSGAEFRELKKELKETRKELASIKKEILEMRGKI